MKIEYSSKFSTKPDSLSQLYTLNLNKIKFGYNFTNVNSQVNSRGHQ